MLILIAVLKRQNMHTRMHTCMLYLHSKMVHSCARSWLTPMYVFSILSTMLRWDYFNTSQSNSSDKIVYLTSACLPEIFQKSVTGIKVNSKGNSNEFLCGIINLLLKSMSANSLNRPFTLNKARITTTNRYGELF